MSGSLCKSIFFELNLFSVNQIFTETFKPYVSKLTGNLFFFWWNFVSNCCKMAITYVISLLFLLIFISTWIFFLLVKNKIYTVYLCLNSCRTYSLLWSRFNIFIEWSFLTIDNVNEVIAGSLVMACIILNGFKKWTKMCKYLCK